jgi:hypothetical protein
MSAHTILLVYTILVSTIAQQPDSLTTPTSIQAAEQEGQIYPHANTEPPPSILKVDEVIGSAERKCVEIPAGVMPAWPGSYRKSGEFVAGGEIGALRAGREAKVPWSPFHDPAGIGATLLVRGSRLDEPGITSRFVSSNYAWPIRELRQPVKDSVVDRDHAFFPSGFMLPSSGRWLLVATSGNDWGCFVVTVQ